MKRSRRFTRCILLAVITAVLAFVTWSRLPAQTIGFSSSIMHDDNVLDNFSPVPDNILQLQLECSKDWDFDRLSLSGYYTGAGLLYRDLTARNFHVHALTLSGSFQCENHDDDGEETETGDSTGAPPPPVPPVQNDSTDHFIEGEITGGAQFDQDIYLVYDSRRVGATLIFRQPLGSSVSLRPAWSVMFNDYPDLQGLGNLQNSFTMNAGTSLLTGNWISLAYSWSIKSYPRTSAYLLTYTADTTIVFHTHGKPIITHQTVTRHRLTQLNSPTVRQSSLSFVMKQSLSTGTSFKTTYALRMEPTAEARVIPELGHGAGAVGITGLNDDIFDDPFSYSADEYQIEATQSLPLSFTLSFSGGFSSKRYSYNATDLADSVLGFQRIDKRTLVGVGVSRAFRWETGLTLTARVEYQFMRNESNSAYYEFDKHTVAASLQVLF